jgi:hypothetical protein
MLELLVLLIVGVGALFLIIALLPLVIWLVVTGRQPSAITVLKSGA